MLTTVLTSIKVVFNMRVVNYMLTNKIRITVLICFVRRGLCYRWFGHLQRFDFKIQLEYTWVGKATPTKCGFSQQR